MNLLVNKDVYEPVTTYIEKVKEEMHASGAALVIMKDNKIVHEYYSGTHHFENGAKKVDDLHSLMSIQLE